jgi:3-oxosteroid 1-dehydrogenase
VSTAEETDLEKDVVVVGAGGAGMAAALTAARNGLSVLLVDKAAAFGGSTARSGGGVWVPDNPVLRAAGHGETGDDAAVYLKHIVGESGDNDLQQAFLRHGPDAVAMLISETPLKLRWVPGYSDYYPEAPGGRASGRSVEPAPFSARHLGPDRALLNPPYLAAGASVAITQADFRWLNLIARHPRGVARALRVGLRSWIARARGIELLTMGQALAGGLWVALRRRDIPVWLNCPMIDLGTDENGRVDRITLLHDGVETVVRARRAVILSAGGFERDEELRKEHQQAPVGTAWTVGAQENTGDAIRLGLALNADTTLMDDAWWGPSLPLPRGPYFLLAERALPGCLMVNQAGQRYVNEAAPYVDAVHAMYAAHTDQSPAIPSWLIFDQRYRDRYIFAGRGPRQPLSKKWYDAGVVVKADTLDALAVRIGTPAETLRATVDRFNLGANRGVDQDFHKGESAYDRYYGDPRVRPNPCLAALVKPPFYAAQIVPGDLGTKGGLRTDAQARVLRRDGSVIEGLYAAGNTSSQVMGHSYAGPGATLGPAITFGYIAANHIAENP